MRPAGPRAVALDVLLRVGAGGASDRCLDRALRGAALEDRDRALVTELVYGVLRRQRSLDAELARHSRRPLAELDDAVLIALRLGAYQCRHLDRVPDHAAVDTIVEVVKGRRPAAAGFVNAVLRSLLRESDTGPETGVPGGAGGEGERRGAAAEAAGLAERFDVPDWWARRWQERFGAPAAAAWLAATLQPAPLALRPHPRVLAADELVERLAGKGIEVRASEMAPGGLRVVAGNLAGSASLAAGAFAARGEAGQLVAALLPALPGELVLDACAGRGGKAIQIAEDRGPRLLVANDAASWRARACAAAARAAATPEVRPLVADLSRPAPLAGRFDAILVDAPCSGLGTVRRRPELKWRNSPERLARLTGLQRAILRHSAALLAAGGALLYATCSTEPEENEEVVAALLEERPDLAPRPIALPEGADPRLLGADGCFRTWPLFPDLEGFFAALLVKTG